MKWIPYDFLLTRLPLILGYVTVVSSIVWSWRSLLGYSDWSRMQCLAQVSSVMILHLPDCYYFSKDGQFIQFIPKTTIPGDFFGINIRLKADQDFFQKWELAILISSLVLNKVSACREPRVRSGRSGSWQFSSPLIQSSYGPGITLTLTEISYRCQYILVWGLISSGELQQ